MSEAVGKINREGRLIYWSKPENLSKLDFLFGGKKEMVDWNWHRDFLKLDKTEKTNLTSEEKMAILKKEFLQKKYDLLWLEITSPEIKKIGLHVVSVVSPDLQPMHLEEEIPYLFGKRLTEVPRKLGYSVAEELNRDPHPFP